MPVAASVSGTMTRTGLAGVAAEGTLQASDPAPAGFAAGTLAADRTKFLAFYARTRNTRPDVAIEGEVLTTLVDQVTLDETLDDPTRFATFKLSDRRAAFFDPATVAAGDRAVTVDLWAGPPGGVKAWRAFRGLTEQNQNEQPFRPRGTFRAASNAKGWTQKGCLRLEAFSGMTRGEILAAYAESAGVTIANLGDLGGGIVRKPVDIAGDSVVDLVKKFGEVEGWIARETDDGTGLEILNEDTLLDGSPIFELDESNYFDVAEVAPSRPVTNWVLSSTRIKDSSASVDGADAVPGSPAEADGALVVERTEVAGYDSAGRPTLVVTEVSKLMGAEVLRVVSSFATVATQGVTNGPAVFQKTEEVYTAQVWEPFLYYDAPGSAPRYRPSTQLNERHVRKYALAGVPCSTGTGYTWESGGQFTTPSAVWMNTETLDEVFSWADCFLLTAQKIRTAYYAPKVGSGGYAYPDGTLRSTSSYTFTYTEIETTTWTDFRNTGTPRVEARIYLEAYGGLPETFGPSRTTTKVFQGNASNSVYGITESTTEADGTSTTKTTDSISGAVPGAPTGSADVPLFEQEVVLVDFDATAASGFTKRTESPGAIDFTESTEELRMIAVRRIRRACSVDYPVTHNAIPFLRVGDHVALTNRSRSLSKKSAYVAAIQRTAAPLNGAMRQVTTLRVPPDWI